MTRTAVGANIQVNIMFKVICSGILLTIGLSLSPLANAQDAAVDCGAGASQCEDVCDGEKRWGLFKGKRFEECAANCEEQLARQCAAGGRDKAEAKAGKARGEKVHPQGKQYGYEKNADKVKGQHGAIASADDRQGDLDAEHELEMEIEEDVELELEETLEEKAEEVKKAKDKAVDKGTEKAKKAEKEK